MLARATVTLLAVLLLSVPHSMSGAGVRERRSDDTGLQTTVERHAALLQSLQAEVAALKTRQQTLSTQVAFFVRFAIDSSSGLPLTPKSTLKFDKVLTNIGQGYDPATGLFTAPVAGTYAFFLSAMSVNGQPSTYLSITKHGVVLDEVFTEGNTDAYDQGSTQVSTHLLAGEQVWVQQASGTAVRGGMWTVFNGYLLQAD